MKILANLELKDIVAGGSDLDVIIYRNSLGFNGAPNILLLDLNTFKYMVTVQQVEYDILSADPAPDLIQANGEVRHQDIGF